MVQITNLKPPESFFEESCIVWCLQSFSQSENFDPVQFEALISLLKNNIDPKDKHLVKLSNIAFEQAIILVELNVDAETLIAAMLYPFVNSMNVDLKDVGEHLSVVVEERVKGVILLDGMRGLQSERAKNSDGLQVENLRKMLLVMVDDVMVVLIKLAERLVNLRMVKNDQAVRQFCAKEINDVYAPLANRLGVGQLKWEMEDLSFRYLHPKEYKNIAKYLSEKRLAREVYVNEVLATIDRKLTAIGVASDLMGRAKHIYSIWKKMQRKKVGFEEIYDVRAVRVLVDKVQDCYSVLGVVHGEWKHIPKEFDDYVATPKENGYRSLHTAVIGPEGKTLEIQIRTHEMHQESELGVAAHWQYKEADSGKAGGYDAKIAWLRQILEWQDEVTDSAQLAADFKNQIFEERIYVFTPLGKLIDLPQGSTPVDFAYRVHTDVGHRCRGAKANGRIIPLTEALETGQRIEILTSKSGEPSRDWLSEHSGYIKSQQAKSKVHQWFKRQDKEKNINAGRVQLESELKKNGLEKVLSKTEFLLVIKQFNFSSKDELYAAIGSGDKGIHQVINSIRNNFAENIVIDRNTVLNRKPKLVKRSASSDILVEGVGNLLTRMASCCKPVPGDEICGYITLGRGIMIHRCDCRYLLASKSRSPEKILQVSWTNQVNKSYLIDLIIMAYDRKGLLSDVTALLSHEKISVTSLNTKVSQKKLEVKIDIQVQVNNLEVVSRLITLLEQLNNIIEVKRSRV
ncbi:MAG: GTP diphosphokinase [Kangiella sp.]|nr:MAG: GTP diphosphokinase [Kangiella sp.]